MHCQDHWETPIEKFLSLWPSIVSDYLTKIISEQPCYWVIFHYMPQFFLKCIIYNDGK